MLLPALLAITKPAAATASLFRWLRHLGAPGLIPLGILDNSVVPLPGSVDVLVVVLSAGQREWWPYYAVMATTGGVLGGYLTYRLARAEGKGRLAKRLKRAQMAKVHGAFDRWGFFAIAVPALLPPPFPMTPFLIAAGAAQYSRNKFILALFLGRGARYTALAALAALYGRQVLNYFAEHAVAVILVATAVVAMGIAFAILRGRHAESKHA